MTEIVCLNAGAAIMVAGLVNDLKAGYEMAKNVVSSGKAWAKLQQLAAATK